MNQYPPGNCLSRRDLLRRACLLAATLALAPGCGIGVPAQPTPRRIPKVGALFGAGPEGGRLPGLLAFIDGLREHGLVDGENVAIEARYAEGRIERLPPLAADLVQLKVDVIYASGTPPTLAARAATDSIPIVMIAVGDPVALGLVASLSRPGGNVTGMANLSQELSGKRLDLLREALPGLARVGVLVNAAVADQSVELGETRLAAQQLGLSLDVQAVRDGPEIEHAIRDLAAAGLQALLVLEDPLFFGIGSVGFEELATQHRLPTMYPIREHLDRGGLMFYGPSYVIDAHRRGAAHVDRILKGATPVDLPVELPTRFYFAINLKTAQALGLTLPPSILAQATDIVQ